MTTCPAAVLKPDYFAKEAAVHCFFKNNRNGPL